MTNKKTNLSKLMSYVLRHHPEELGITLDKNGWVDLKNFTQSLQSRDKTISVDKVREVVESCEKQRFSIDETQQKIRANQGHSIQVDLQLRAQQPPDILYHGTVDRFLDSILRVGLLPQQRHHVHLTESLNTAKSVGARRGRAIILEIETGELVSNGAQFYLSENQVWLIDHVPAQYIKLKQQ